jgi:hypothetical protein
MIAVVTSSLRPAGGRRSPCCSSIAIWPLIVGTMHRITPKSLGRKPQRLSPASGNRRSTALSDTRHVTPARGPGVKSP